MVHERYSRGVATDGKDDLAETNSGDRPRDHAAPRKQDAASIFRGIARLVTTLRFKRVSLPHTALRLHPRRRDLRGALSYGPELLEQRYVFRIPTHKKYLTPTAIHRLGFVRLAHALPIGK